MKTIINKTIKELKSDFQSPTLAVKNDYKFLPIFENNEVSRVNELEKTAIFSNLFQLKKESAKLMILQVWVIFIRYIIPLFGLLILSAIEQKGLSDVYFYANATAIILCLYLYFKMDIIKNLMLKVTILIFVTSAFATLFHFSIGIFSADRFFYHFAYAVAFFLVLFFVIKDIFIDATFSKVWYFEQNFYLSKSSPDISKLKKTLVVFFTISALLTSVTLASMGVLLTSKKIEIAQKLSKKE